MTTEIKSTAEILRHKAEELANKKLSRSESKLSELETQKLIHELEVHQIELEMQNEELLLAKTEALHAVERYTELYDFAPTGYFTLSKEGIIFELNLYGSQILGKERVYLTNRSFGYFVSDNTKTIFYHFLENIFDSRAKETCEISLITNENALIHVILTGLVSEKREQCLITAVDITDRRLTEEDLHDKIKELEEFIYLSNGREQTMISLKKEANELFKKNGEEEKYE
ncbi:MAG TPA: PAS domain-containing protein [Paludibacter sp.]